MSKYTSPYQPFLFRFLHGLTGICLILAILSALWTYSTYDGRWLSLPLPDYKAVEGIHGTFGLYTLLIFPVFLRYSFQRGQKRLIQPNAFSTLSKARTKVGSPIWWYTLNRLINTLALFALTFALFSGKMMDSTWLPKGELNHAWYIAHVISWVVMVSVIALHLLMNAKVGGAPLLLSVWQTRIRTQDSPRLWPRQISAWWMRAQPTGWAERWHWLIGLPQAELAIWISLVLAWIISLIKEAADLFA